MEADEAGTLAVLTARRATMDGLIAGHHGRIVNTAGDGVLAEFASVVDAVACAVAVQEAVEQANDGAPEAKRMRFRIGVNLGDVLVQGGNLFGDGVNVAARLETLAQPGGIVVSATVRDHVGDRLPLSFSDLGEQAVKNIARPIRAFRVGAAAGLAPPPGERPTLARPDKPSLAVLPFQNLSGDPEQEYFADAMVEDITTALSRVKAFFVIARNSAFTYKGKPVDVKRIGQELGVRYLVEGSVRRAGDRVRITGQLIDAETGAHLWADRYDGPLADVFELQDRVASSIVGAIEPSLLQAELARSIGKPTASMAAYDCVQRALGSLLQPDREGIDDCLTFARRALEMDPRYALAHALVCLCYANRRNAQWVTDDAAEIAEGTRAAHVAVQLAADDPTVLTQAGVGLALLDGDTDTAIPWLDRAILLNPNSAMAFGRGATLRNFVGDYDTAVEHATRAMRLSPFDPRIFLCSYAIGMAHFFRRNLPEAIRWLRAARQQNPHWAGSHLALASALAHDGRLDEARQAMARHAALRPTFTAAAARRRGLYKVTRDSDYWLEGAVMAGLPET